MKVAYNLPSQWYFPGQVLSKNEASTDLYRILDGVGPTDNHSGFGTKLGLYGLNFLILYIDYKMFIGSPDGTYMSGKHFWDVPNFQTIGKSQFQFEPYFGNPTTGLKSCQYKGEMSTHLL